VFAAGRASVQTISLPYRHLGRHPQIFFWELSHRWPYNENYLRSGKGTFFTEGETWTGSQTFVAVFSWQYS
jgi:hypothetical protein